jgi:hypothetical protein
MWLTAPQAQGDPENAAIVDALAILSTEANHVSCVLKAAKNRRSHSCAADPAEFG